MRQDARSGSIRWRAGGCVAAALIGINLFAAAPAAADEVAPAAPNQAPPGPQGYPGQKKNGVTVGADFTLSLLNVVQGNLVNSFAIQGGIFGGYKIDRFIFGLAVDIGRISQDQSQTFNGTTTSNSTTVTNLLVLPGVRATILRSSDQRADLFGQLDLGWGRAFNDRSTVPPNPQPNNTTSDNNLFVYQVGLGLRYWMHPSFAFYVVPILRGSFMFSSSTQINVPQPSSTASVIAITTIDANLGFLGVF